jgi:hypothetical protein
MANHRRIKRATVSLASFLLASTSAAHSSPEDTSQVREEKESGSMKFSSDTFEHLQKFLERLRSDFTFRLNYLNSPIDTLEREGFSKNLQNEILREDGFYVQTPTTTTEGIHADDGCVLTCACSGCCFTNSGGSGGGSGGSGGGSGGSGGCRGVEEKTVC